MADPKRDAPHHPSHPGNYQGKIPDDRTGGRGGGRRIAVILAVLVFVLAVVWLMIGGGEQVGDQTLGEPAGVGESAAVADGEAEDIEPPHAAIGEASEAETELAPDVIDGEEDAAGEPEAQ